MLIFHNHIPRTSGEVINHSIARLQTINSLVIKPTDIINRQDLYGKDYVCGHIGQYPKELMSDVVSFSIVRNPYDQFMSWFWLMFMQGIWHGRPDNNKSAYDYMDYLLSTPNYINGMSNMQSKFMTGHIDLEIWNANIDPIEKTKSDSCLTRYNLTESAINQAIQENIVHSVEHRHLLTEKVNRLFLNYFNVKNAIVDIDLPGHAHPKQHPYLFDMPESWSKRINSALEIDQYLYNKVLEQDKKSAIIIT